MSYDSLFIEGRDDSFDTKGTYIIESFQQGTVWLSLAVNENDVLHGYTPDQARKLAKRLKKAAKHAEGVQ